MFLWQQNCEHSKRWQHLFEKGSSTGSPLAVGTAGVDTPVFSTTATRHGHFPPIRGPTLAAT